MMSRSRLVPTVVMILVTLALPVVGLAADPQVTVMGQEGVPATLGPQVGPNVSTLTLVPGATVKILSGRDAVADGSAAGATVVAVNIPSTYEHYYYNSGGGSVLADLGLPFGAKIWQIDGYGYRTTAGTQEWKSRVGQILDTDSWTKVDDLASPSATGPTHVTRSYASGFTMQLGYDFFLELGPTSVASGYVAAVVQYTLPTMSLVPITPARVFDSRFAAFGGPIATGGSRLVNVKDAIDPLTGLVSVANAVPEGARAVSYNLTIVSTVGAGYVAVVPGNSTTVTSSSINWYTSDQILANSGVIGLGSGAAERQVTLVVGGSGGSSTQVILDITGYYK
jgi:hypothetical protein